MFSFGKNWKNFLQTLNEERINTAKKSLVDFLRLENLNGKTFLDIGSGSGLFSLVAKKLGAQKIVSIDVDPFSVACTKYLCEQAGKDSNWLIYENSVLNEEFMGGLGKFDVVYAWGSLHHTGNMWQAIERAAQHVKGGGLFQLAIYNRVDERWGSKFWLNLKKRYNNSPIIIKCLIEIGYMSKLIAYYIIRGRNPIGVVKDFKRKRGMSWRHDIIDWLGGYPYEFATVEEIFLFMKKKFPDFKLENIKTTNGLGNNQFLFKRD
ncbi:MAG: methyltransferase family protein [Parcubacteria group bacterium Licking1014_17]|nr:MAG: methyltransferase family protein [Parcubacteria group bacterium Licking1014_17]